MNSHPEIIKKCRYHGMHDAAYPRFPVYENVTILAPGPNGRDFWKDVKYDDDEVIAVNAGIMIPVPANIWIVADGNAVKCDWFNWGCKKFGSLKVWSEAIYQRTQEIGDNTFWMYPNHPDQVEDFLKLPFAVDPDFYRPTETVTGIAIDFAVRHGAKHINLIGVDMEGGYHDDPPELKRDTVNSYMRDSLQREIKYFQEHGITFKSLSPTRLEI